MNCFRYNGIIAFVSRVYARVHVSLDRRTDRPGGPLSPPLTGSIDLALRDVVLRGVDYRFFGGILGKSLNEVTTYHRARISLCITCRVFGPHVRFDRATSAITLTAIGIADRASVRVNQTVRLAHLAAVTSYETEHEAKSERLVLLGGFV